MFFLLCCQLSNCVAQTPKPKHTYTRKSPTGNEKIHRASFCERPLDKSSTTTIPPPSDSPSVRCHSNAERRASLKALYHCYSLAVCLHCCSPRSDLAPQLYKSVIACFISLAPQLLLIGRGAEPSSLRERETRFEKVVK